MTTLQYSQTALQAFSNSLHLYFKVNDDESDLVALTDRQTYCSFCGDQQQLQFASEVDWFVVSAHAGFFEGFGEGWVSVACATDILR